MSEGERLDQVNRLVDDQNLPVTPRLIGLLVLMFGQPLSPIVRLPQRRDSHRRPNQPAARPPRPQPPTRDRAVVQDHLAHISDHRNDAGHPEQRWLFPGLQPGQPLHVFNAAGMLKAIGLPARAARNTSWQQIVQQAPAAILADGLGAQRGTATHHARAAGADYASDPSNTDRSIVERDD